MLEILRDVAAGAIGIFVLILGAFWLEIRRLRGVRHEDRDRITELDSKIKLLKYDFEDYKQEQLGYKAENESKLDRLKWMLKQGLKQLNRLSDGKIKTDGKLGDDV